MIVYVEHIASNYRERFEAKLKEISKDLSLKPAWLTTVMYAESRMNPKAVNAKSGATGLIQFLPSTAAKLGTSTEALKQMDAVKQLDYVKKYFQPYASKISSIYDTYLAVFYPAALGKNDSYILFSKGSAAYTNNAAMDLDKDGKVTKKDVKEWFSKYVKTIDLPTGFIAASSAAMFLIIKKSR
jgi:hypothetical protein